MAKLHRKAADGHPVRRSTSDPSMPRLGMANEAETALDEWEAEGGTSAGAGEGGENAALSRPALDRVLLERLGAALVGEWSNLPVRLQRDVYERAVCVSSPSQRPTMRRRMARFLHDNKMRGRRAPMETLRADDAQPHTPSERKD